MSNTNYSSLPSRGSTNGSKTRLAWKTSSFLQSSTGNSRMTSRMSKFCSSNGRSKFCFVFGTKPSVSDATADGTADATPDDVPSDCPVGCWNPIGYCDC